MYDEELDRAVTLLDRTYGRDVWLARVDSLTLNAGSVNNCIAAQATGTGRYLSGLRDLGFDDAIHSEPNFAAVDHGFEVLPDENYRWNYEPLTAAWRERLVALRAEVGESA